MHASPAPSADPDTGLPQSVPNPADGVRFDCGGGCALSTAGDYLRCAQMLLDGGRLDEARVLGPRTVAMMVTNHMTSDIRPGVSAIDPTRDGYGFGLTVAARQATRGQNILGNPGDFSWSAPSARPSGWIRRTDSRWCFMAQAPGLAPQHYRRLINSLVYQVIVD